MCVVSNIGDMMTRTLPERFPWTNPVVPTSDSPTRAEFEALRREMKEVRALLVAAKRYDAATGQPGCETGEKVELLKRLAELVGVDLSDVFPEAAS